MTLETRRLRTVDQVRAFLDGTGELDVKSGERAAACDFITEALNRLGDARPSRAGKGVIRPFLVKMTGLSRARTARPSCFASSAFQYRATGRIRDRRGPPTRPFPRTRRTRGEGLRGVGRERVRSHRFRGSGPRLSFTLSQSVGSAASGVERLWSMEDAGGLGGSGTFDASRALEAERG